MDKIVAVTFDISDQQCVAYNVLEWHNFIADTRENCESEDLTLDELFDEYYGDEFWFELIDEPVFAVAFDLTSEKFVLAKSGSQVEFYNEMAEDGDYAEEVFWA
jgi:hypothetical protein